MIKGYNMRRDLELKNLQYLAWHNASYVGMAFSGKELPSLQDIMKPPERITDTPVVLTEEERWAQSRSTVLKLMNAGFDVPDATLEKYNLKRG
jgi:hypothetical protein